MFFNTSFYLGVKGTVKPEDGSCLGIITAFRSISGQNSNTLSFTCKWPKDQQEARLIVDYLRRQLNEPFVFWIGDTSQPLSGELCEVKLHSDVANDVYIDQIEVTLKTNF
ncbi:MULTISPECIES: hypothetical protein [Rahnella]|uniref:Phage tail protein n=1 Tax=Rahnella laticis TaxID=2787622 RepID=A0ABS0DZ25_9GAMM|nr:MULTISPECIES: hypothetical protein [Rahnella]MBF7978114.1 hypothetical protein [Rahnella laticis]MBF7998169.1 hypothetical protein [Rahnella sp. LAC-M12]